jgi:L-ascorbate metabolism protein UlaG (beta-lactamase superfamily)
MLAAERPRPWIETERRNHVDTIEIRYFATSAFEVITEGGKRVLIDPCITGWNGKNVSPVALDTVTGIDLILVSHAAPDHFGDTLELARRTGAQVVCDPAVHHILLDSGIEPERVHITAWGMVRQFDGVTVRCVESKHVSCTVHRGSMVTGLPLGFMLSTESGRTIYHPGDTAIFSDLKLFAELYAPEVGMLPISGFPGMPAELSIDEAALVAKWMKLKVVMPTHYTLGSDEPAQFEAAMMRESPTTKVVTLKPGEWVSL